MWIRLLSIAMLIGMPFVGSADPRLFSPHASMESTTATLIGPLTEDGMLLAKSCVACRSQALRLTAQTRLYVGEREVTVAEFNDFLRGGGTHGLGIYYDKTAHTVAKLVVSVNQSQRPAESRN